MRKTILFSVLALSLLTPAVLAERWASSGNFLVDLDNLPEYAIGSVIAASGRSNVLVNADFETGALAPWYGSGWSISTTDPHGGMYCAYDVGNNGIRQDFTPTPVGDVLSVVIWERQPEMAISAIDFFYSPSDYDEYLVFLTATGWQSFDMTGYLRAVGSLQGIRIWGYSGGGPEPDETFIDDILIDITGCTPTETTTWGQIKALF